MAKKEEKKLSITSYRTYDVSIEGITPLLMNRMLDSMYLSKAEKAKGVKEDLTELDRKTWREKMYFSDDGDVFIPRENIKKCLCEGSKDWGGKVTGNLTYTPIVMRSVTIIDQIDLGFKKDEQNKNIVDGFTAIVNGRGKSSGGSKVPRTRPRIFNWGGSFKMIVTDNRLTEDILKVIISEAGITGIGDYRKLGGYGKFKLVGLKQVS